MLTEPTGTPRTLSVFLAALREHSGDYLAARLTAYLGDDRAVIVALPARDGSRVMLDVCQVNAERPNVRVTYPDGTTDLARPATAAILTAQHAHTAWENRPPASPALPADRFAAAVADPAHPDRRAALIELAAGRDAPILTARDVRDASTACHGCGRTFRGARGLRAHQTARHVTAACRPHTPPTNGARP